MLTPLHRLYIQLKPDAGSLEYLQDLQRRLLAATNRSDCQLVPADQLHATIIHIGLISRLHAAVRRCSTIDKNALPGRIEALAIRLTDIAAAYKQTDFVLQPTGTDGFGQDGTTLVLTCAVSAAAAALHTELLTALQEYLRDCGVEDPAACMAADANLRHGLELRPHITLAKTNAAHPAWDAPLRAVHMCIDSVVYPPKS